MAAGNGGKRKAPGPTQNLVSKGKNTSGRPGVTQASRYDKTARKNKTSGKE